MNVAGMRTARCVLGVLMAALVSLHCDGGDGDDGGDGFDGGPRQDTGTDSGVATDAGVEDSGRPDTGTVDTGVSDIPEIAVGDPYGETGVIDPPGDKDLFRFQGTAGDWLRIITRTGNSPADTVLTLFDANMNQLAQSDDDIPRTGTDSEISFHVPESGTYYLEVQEYSTWAGDPDVGGPTFTYSVRVRVWDDSEDGVVIDPENGDDAASAVDYEGGTILGTFRDGSDVDVYQVTIPTLTATIANFEVSILPQGPDGQGSTSPAGEVWVTDATGAQVLARVDHSAGHRSLEPPLTAGDYLLFVAHPGAAAGSNDFYVLRFRLLQDNPPERGDPANDTLAGAETLEVGVNEGVRSSFVLADLPEGDVDYFRFDLMPNEELSVACGAESLGSAVRMLTAEVRDGTDSTLQTMTEDETGLFIPPFAPTSSTVYIRLDAGPPDTEVQRTFVRCGLRAAVPN